MMCTPPASLTRTLNLSVKLSGVGKGFWSHAPPTPIMRLMLRMLPSPKFCTNVEPKPTSIGFFVMGHRKVPSGISHGIMLSMARVPMSSEIAAIAVEIPPIAAPARTRLRATLERSFEASPDFLPLPSAPFHSTFFAISPLLMADPSVLVKPPWSRAAFQKFFFSCSLSRVIFLRSASSCLRSSKAFFFSSGVIFSKPSSQKARSDSRSWMVLRPVMPFH